VGSEREGAAADSTLTALYHRALPLVYGYLLPRCGSAGLAADLTADTFMAAVAAAKRDHPPDLTVAWLVGVARHKLVDHWRRTELERRKLGVIDCDAEPAEDPWDAQLDVAAAHIALSRLSANHALRTAFPSSLAGRYPCDYYETSVTIGLAPLSLNPPA
jgi:RNA polymerase sigma-70 factor, ECF subfamily